MQPFNTTTMKLYTRLFFGVLTIWASCTGQNTAKSANTHPTITLGDTVTELSNSIWIVFQATNGDYWFGSDTDGAYRFDGKTVMHYSAKDGLSSNSIRGIQEDKQGNIYFSTLAGINKFDGQFFALLTAIPSNGPGDHWKLQADDLWFNMLGKTGENGPYRYDGKDLFQLEFPKHYLADDYFKKFPNKSWSPYEVYNLYKDSMGNMWFGTSNFGICRYDGKSLSWLYEDHLTNTPNGGSFGIRSIVEDTKGKFWFCNTRYRYNISADSINENGKILIKYDKEKGIEDIEPGDGTDHVYFMSVTTDNNGELWMATYDQGVYRYDGEKTTHYPVKDGTEDVTLFSIYKDKRGDLWLGTHKSGLFKFNGTRFEKFNL